MKPIYKPEMGSGDWSETTEEWHGADREFCLQDQNNTLNYIKIGGKGQHWDVVFHRTLGSFEIVKKHLLFEEAIIFAEGYLAGRPHV